MWVWFWLVVDGVSTVEQTVKGHTEIGNAGIVRCAWAMQESFGSLTEGIKGSYVISEATCFVAKGALIQAMVREAVHRLWRS